MYTHEQAFQKSLAYFSEDNLAADVFLSKYALKDNDGNLLESTPHEMHERIAKEFSRIESRKFKSPLSYDKIFSLLKNFKYIVPQGSPMFGIGNNYQIVSLSNCYVLEAPEDCYNSILDIDKQLVNISKRRGGVGIDLDKLRPAGTVTKNASRTSTGIVSWMRRYSNSIREVGQSGRRGALMLTLSVHHPDILQFATIKNNDTEVTGANISVKLTKEFLDALENDAEYELRWPINDTNSPVVSKMVKAKDVWNTIINSAWLRAEPGLIMWDNVQKGPADCYEEYRSVSTNPCSEITLSSLDSCRLLSLNLFSYVVNPFTDDAYFDFDLFYEHAQIAQRLMDDIIDLEAEKIEAILAKIDSDNESDDIKRPEREMWEKILRFNNEGRRTGTGITALGDVMAALNIPYASNASIELTEKIYRTLKLGCYRSSVDMAKELGHFKVWDAEKEKDNEHLLRIKKEDPLLYADMQKYGRRNIALLTTAPTGTISLLTQTTSGIEPLFRLEEYTRRKKINPNDAHARVDFTDQNGDKWQEYKVYHPKVQMWMDITGETDIKLSPWYGATSENIDWTKRVELQAAAQRHVCHAISSTINLPNNVTEEEVAKIYQTAFKSGCKGITIYRDGCRTGVLIEKKDSAKEVNKGRPKNLPCEVHHVSTGGQSYLVLVGLLDEKPYEVFACRNGILDKSVKTGTIQKKRANFYKAVFDDETELSPITASMSEMEEIISRLTSGLLRCGADMHTVVKQLEKVGETKEIHSFARALSRVLKKYISDGTKEDGECPECKQHALEREAGCVICKYCGWSKCL